MFGTILLTIILTLMAIVVAMGIYYYIHRDRIDAEQAKIQAALRAWSIAQQEQATDQAIRMATHQAVERMMQEARGSGSGRK